MHICIKYTLFIIFFFTITLDLQGQYYWQQAVEYDIEVEINTKKNCMDGEMEVIYTNNSPDTISRMFFHLYYNAFQPNSMMDVRSRQLPDPDPRVADRISKLSKDEIGFHDIKEVEQNDKDLDFIVDGTILEVKLAEPLLPGESTEIEVEFESQIPVQIRRTGRDNKEGIRYSMSQWYPKVCEYDVDGWHPNPYIAREFYGVWGNFDVSITIDKDYIVAAGGSLINDPSKDNGRKRTWKWQAKNVHDFVWAADPDYKHDSLVRENGCTLHFYYQPGEATDDAWGKLPEIMDKAMDFIEANYGEYPYDTYSFIQGGDGGMEYPLATLITGERSLPSLVGVSVHELMHNWYQMILGTNEALYAWMDEGFTSYTSDEVVNHLKRTGLMPGFNPVDDPHAGSMTGYRNFAQTPFEEALITHADHYRRNQAYGIAAYVKGAVFLNQLSYIIGKSALDKTMLRYYDKWKFKHPTDKRFIRVAEETSGMVLDWYQEYWVHSTKKIDYAIDTVREASRKTEIVLKKFGDMPMPLDVVVTLTDGTKQGYNLPLRLMRGHKKDEGLYDDFKILEDWPWTHPEYILTIPVRMKDIQSIELDPSNRMADIDLSNNSWSPRS
jgi:hypothetical protein